MKVWLFTLAENQKYWGNQGYENIPASTYSYDSFVPNYRQVAVGDVVIERIGTRINGVSTIDGISVKRGTKEIFRCPDCGNSRLRKRKTVSPIWICENSHEFDTPEVDTRQSIQCKAEYAVGYVELDEPIDSGLIEPALVSGNRMFAIQEVGLQKLLNSRDERLAPLTARLQVHADTEPRTSGFSPTIRNLGGLEDSEGQVDFGSTENIIRGPRVEEADALGRLKSFLAGCCAEDDNSSAAHNKTRLPIPKEDFDQVNAEVDAASALLLAPKLETSRLSPLIKLLEKLKVYLDLFLQNASASMGKATGAIAIAVVLDMTGLLDTAIKALSHLAR